MHKKKLSKRSITLAGDRKSGLDAIKEYKSDKYERSEG
jgi:hypothetical protein